MVSINKQYAFTHGALSSLDDTAWQLPALAEDLTVDEVVQMARELLRVNQAIGLKSVTIERNNHRSPMRLHFDLVEQNRNSATIDANLVIDFSESRYANVDEAVLYTDPVLFVSDQFTHASGQAVSSVLDLRQRRILNLAEFNNPAPAVLPGTGKQVSRVSRDINVSRAGGNYEYIIGDKADRPTEYVSRVAPVHGVTGTVVVVGYMADPDSNLMADPYLLASHGVMSMPIGRHITTELENPYYLNDDPALVTMVETMAEIRAFALLGYVA